MEELCGREKEKKVINAGNVLGDTQTPRRTMLVGS